MASFILASDKDRLRASDFTAGVRRLRGKTQKQIGEWAERFCAMGWLRPENENAPVAKAWLVAPQLRAHFIERREQARVAHFIERREQARVARAAAHEILKAGGSRGRA